MVTKNPRRAQEPQNTSRGAGPAAPASAAASRPASTSMYNPDPVESAPPQSGLTAFVDQRVMPGSVPLETGGSADIEVAERAVEEALDGDEGLAEAIARIRQTRKPLGAYTQKLALPVRQGYHRHWFNDVAGRIDEAKANGWAHVKGTDGKPIARCVGTGRDKGSMYAFAMEIPEVFWREDMDARHADAAARVAALKSTPFRAPQGTAQASDTGKFYSPTEQAPISIEKH